jgi:hypothetical protein
VVRSQPPTQAAAPGAARRQAATPSWHGTLVRNERVQRLELVRRERLDRVDLVRHERIEREIVARERPTVTRAVAVPSTPRPNDAPVRDVSGRRAAAPLAATGRPTGGTGQPAVDVERLTEQVVRRIERRALAQRERLGRT